MDFVVLVGFTSESSIQRGQGQIEPGILRGTGEIIDFVLEMMNLDSNDEFGATSYHGSSSSCTRCVFINLEMKILQSKMKILQSEMKIFQ